MTIDGGIFNPAPQNEDPFARRNRQETVAKTLLDSQREAARKTEDVAKVAEKPTVYKPAFPI